MYVRSYHISICNYDLMHLHVRTYVCTLSVSFVQRRYSKSQTSTVSPTYVDVCTRAGQYYRHYAILRYAISISQTFSHVSNITYAIILQNIATYCRLYLIFHGKYISTIITISMLVNE